MNKSRAPCLPALAIVFLATGVAVSAPPQRPGATSPGPSQGQAHGPGTMVPAQRPRPNPAGPIVPGPVPRFGDSLPGLTPAQQLDFAAGLEEFTHVETPEGGLGPIFNNVSCVACHGAPAIGGSSDILVTRFGRATPSGFDALSALGGSLLQSFAVDPAAQEVVPPAANVVARRQSTPLFGFGLIEAIPDAAILRGARGPKPDGVRGRAAVVDDVASGQRRVGRFGWKAQQATLLSFAGDAYLNEMGITSRLFPVENAPNGDETLLARFDPIEDPEDQVDPVTGKGDIDHAADFMRLLAPPPRGAISLSSRQGEAVFHQTGCAVCHVPEFLTGPNDVAALDRKPVELYSDLLLHDMGSLGDGIGQAAAGPREFRTPPLWGLRASAPYLHDGRAGSVEEAVVAHDGEGAVSRGRFLRLGPTQRRQLLDFLGSL